MTYEDFVLGRDPKACASSPIAPETAFFREFSAPLPRLSLFGPFQWCEAPCATSPGADFPDDPETLS
jgi:hypothetical protein